VEWQQLASHGRRVVGENFAHPMCKIDEQSDHRGYMGHTYTKVDRNWRIAVIRPEVLYAPGEFLKIARPDDVEEEKKEG
jgi:scytalone dehydratase